MTNKVIEHELICSRLNDIYRNKNNDYGYSFANVRKAVGPNAIMVRLYDEVERLNTLLGGTKQKVKDESIEDSLMELANYCIMELVERKMDKINDAKTTIYPETESQKELFIKYLNSVYGINKKISLELGPVNDRGIYLYNIKPTEEP